MTAQTPPVTSVYDRFTKLAKRAMVAARDAADSLEHAHVGTEHLLLGLAQTAGAASESLRAEGLELGRARAEVARIIDESARQQGITTSRAESAQNALAAIGIDVGEIQRRANETFGPGALKYPRAAFSVLAKKSLQAALQQARALGTEVVDTQHLLLGVLATGGTAVRVLTNLEVDPERLRRSVLERAGTGPTPTPPPSSAPPSETGA